MSKKQVTRAINSIKKSLLILSESKKEILNIRLEKLDLQKIVYMKCYLLYIYCLNDLNDKIDSLSELYDNDGGRLTTLARNVRNICNKYSVVKVESAHKHKPTFKNKPLVDEIIKRSFNCCVCVSFSELLQLSEDEFINIMKIQYKKISKFKLGKAKVSSWRDEYEQITTIFINEFENYNPEILNYYIVFEMKQPADLKNLDLNKFVYCDAVIVGEDGFVALEFKKLDSKKIAYDHKQALKYTHRLRHHKIARKQHKKYTYVVYTKEIDDNLYTYKDKRYFWYSNTNGIAKDLCTRFFDSNNFEVNIDKWLHAEYCEKRTRRKFKTNKKKRVIR